LNVLIIILVSLVLRLIYFQGFVLGDDGFELGLMQAPHWTSSAYHNQLLIRFIAWGPNALILKLFGTHLCSFFLPTVAMSASFSALGYAYLRRIGYAPGAALAAGLFIASVPFEILLGTLRANDLIVAWCMAIALLTWLWPTRHRLAAGLLCGVWLWLAFYVKLWAYYVLPGMIVVALWQWKDPGLRRAALGFAISTAALHGVASIFWALKLGHAFPFLTYMPATYPAPRHTLADLFQQYPRMILEGSPFGTTLFGVLPWIVLITMTIKLVQHVWGNRTPAWDKTDLWLAAWTLSFFVFLNFWTSHFRLDQYYSPARIFRYLAPLSFPLALIAAKNLIDISHAWRDDRWTRRVMAILWVGLFSVNLVQARQATQPGRDYRQATRQALAFIQNRPSTPRVITDYWQGTFFHNVYLKQALPGISVESSPAYLSATNCEAWIQTHQSAWPKETLLITGLSDYTHYGCTTCGMRLSQFNAPLDAIWTLGAELGSLPYGPSQEPARIWIKQ